MQSKIAELQSQIDHLDQLIQQGAADAQLNLWEMKRRELKDQLDAALAEEAQQATVEKATENAGFIFDMMEVDGLTAPEIITDDTQYKLIRKGVQTFVVGLTTSHISTVKALETLLQDQDSMIKILTDRAEHFESENEQIKNEKQIVEAKNFELNQDNVSLSDKVRKGAELLYDATQQIDQQKQHISDLQTQIAIGVRSSLNVIDIPQDTSKMAADIIARKVRITNVAFKDKNGIDLRLKTAEIVLTGEPVEYEAIYEKRYVILNADEAEQYRIYETNRKAEIEAQNTIIPTIEQQIDPVSEVEAPAEQVTFQPEAGHELGEGLLVDGTNVSHERDAQTENSEVEEFVSVAVFNTAVKLIFEKLGEVNARVDKIEAQITLPIAG